MRFYAACLAAYNAGYLHGAWIDASSDEDEMMAEVTAMLAASPIPGAEEWAIHDYEDLPRSFGEYTGLAQIAEFVELVEFSAEVGGPEDCADVAALVDHFGSVDDATGALRDRFVGAWNTFREYADSTADESMACAGPVPDWITNYFDYESYARDLEMDMVVIELAGGVAIFHA